MTKLKVAVHGAAGRMGQRLVAIASAAEDIDVMAALEHADHPNLGQDVGTLSGVGPIGVPLTASLTAKTDALIDFSVPDAVALITATCVEKKLPLAVATTGLTERQQDQLRAAAAKIPIVWAPSMSLAVNLVMKLSQIAGEALKDHPTGADVEIIERHHRYKEDAPSGTALRFGQIIAQAMGQTGKRHGREGRPGQRPHGEIGYHAIRVGDNPGEHTVVFGLLGETIELRVAATSRDCYAHGALMAARFVAQQPPGLYDMNDVLGL